MADTNPNPLQPAAVTSTKNTEALFADLVAQVALVKKAIAAEKAGGPAALAGLVPEAVAAVQTDVKAFEAALPEIKAGCKSSEFWVTVGAAAAGAGYLAITGHDLPVNLTVLIGAVVGIYTAARSMLKAKAGAA